MKSFHPDFMISAGFFLAALLLYTPGIWWGLPHATAADRVQAWGQDELAPIGPIGEPFNTIFRHSPPYNAQYPLFQYLLEAVAIVPFLGMLYLTKGIQGFSPIYPYGLADPVLSLKIMTLLGRSVNLLMAAGVVVAAYWTGKALWNRNTGLLAAILVMLSYPMFYYSRTSNVDMGALFWTALGLMVFAWILADRITTRRLVALGIFTGLATATKDPSYAVFAAVIPIIVVLIIKPQRTTPQGFWRAWIGAFWGLLAFIGVYIFASGLVFNIPRYLGHLEFITHGGAVGRGTVFYFRNPATLKGYWQAALETWHWLLEGLSWPLAFLSIGGLILAGLRAPRTVWFVLPVLGILAGVILPVRFAEFRFVMIIGYVLAFFAAFILSYGLDHSRQIIRLLTWSALIFVCGYTLLRGFDLTNQMINDSRNQVSKWFIQVGKPGDRVGYYGAPLKLPHFESNIGTVSMPDQIGSLTDPGKPFSPPEFILVIPVQTFEPVHEWTLAEADYQALRSGTTGYDYLGTIQARSLFSSRPLASVNPPVQIYARKDRSADLTLP